MTNRKKSTAFKVTVVCVSLFAILLVSLCFYFNLGDVFEPERTTFCYDYKDMFSDYEEQSINYFCKKVQEKNKVTVFVATCKRLGWSAEMNGERFCYKEGFNTLDNFIVIIINSGSANINGEVKNTDYHFDIYTYGISASKISNHEIDAVLYSEGGDLILESNSSDAVRGLEICIEKLGIAYSFILVKNSWIVICIVTLILALLLAWLVIIIIKKSYTRQRKNETFSYITNSKLNLKIENDYYVRSVVTSSYISNSSSEHGGGHSSGGHSSGGGGGSGHRGGHSSGGGGGSGHRGGR